LFSIFDEALSVALDAHFSGKNKSPQLMFQSNIPSAFVFERQCHACAVRPHLSIFDCHVEFHDLGYPQISQRTTGGLYCPSSSIGPRLPARANNLYHLIN
jgi:hypothetical protein